MLSKATKQLKKWEGDFGKKYTDRNMMTVSGQDEMYRREFGITRMAMNSMFLSGLDKGIKILEVGANIGNQLLSLQEIGFKNLYGIEPQDYALEIARKRSKGINFVKGNAFDLPFKDGYFDLVFTSGVLIHINPKDIEKALSEIHRCSRKYIWGFEYFAKDHLDIVYRGEKNLLWKGDFSKLYQRTFSDLSLVKDKKFKYTSNSNVDDMFLLKKKLDPCKDARISARSPVLKKPVLQGKTIYLEGLSDKHVSQRYADWMNDKEVCSQTRHGARKNTLEMIREYVRSVDRSEDVAVFAVMTKKDRKHIGNISLGVNWGADYGEISIILGDKEYWGRGIGTEAYKLVTDYGFNVLGLHKLKSGMTLKNKGMIKVAEKAGMIKEAILKEDAFLGTGEYVDIVQYMIINPKHGKRKE